MTETDYTKLPWNLSVRDAERLRRLEELLLEGFVLDPEVEMKRVSALSDKQLEEEIEETTKALQAYADDETLLPGGE